MTYLARFMVCAALWASISEHVIAQDDVGGQAGDMCKVRIPQGGDFLMVWSPAGKFRMGGVQGIEAVDVSLTNGFWIAQTETTQQQYTAVTGKSPWSAFQGGDRSLKSGPKYPASCVTHSEAIAYCDRLTELERASGKLAVGWKYALPTSAQWEYACRAGTTTSFSFDGPDTLINDYAWQMGNTREEPYAHVVGTKKQNPWGLHDMYGNVSEWCLDGSTDEDDIHLPGGIDPFVAPATPKTDRVKRGGGFVNNPIDCRSGVQFGQSPETRDQGTGFRVVRVRTK